MDTSKEDNDSKRRANRALTQRYDMHALRKIQKLEDDFRVKLSSVYGCDADDLPVELDTLALYNEEPDSRRGILVELFKNAPQDCSSIIGELLDELSQLQLTPISARK